MDNLSVKNNTRNREDWIQVVSLPETLRPDVMAADVLIVPSMMLAQPKAFMVGTMDLYAWLKVQMGNRIEICIADEDYEEIELNSRALRLGNFWVKSVALSLFINVLGAYIYDKIKESEPIEVVAEKPECQQPVTVSFTIAVEDTLGKKKEFHYEGPAADYHVVAENIKKLWNEE